METSAGFWLLAVLLVAVTSFSQDQAVKYFKVGDTLQLRPQQVSGPINSIVWKFDKNLLAEWVKDSIELTYYSRFKGRTTLNTDTGVLEIRDMTAEDSGVYSVEINNQVQSQVYKTVAVEAVPQPVVSVRPLLCNSTSKSCTLSCDGDVSNAGPVEYFWRIGDGEWKQSGTNMEIIGDEETQRVPTFSCRMKNRVSERDSKPLFNPLFQIKPADCGHWMIVLGAVMRSLAIVALFVAVVYFLCQKLLSVCVCKHRKGHNDAV
ncbi:CD48 antigen-like [Oreochromis aureus]|uniref:CD48 antigen-like n=1 Tax=Oreochromis aureus TaxID=47969 RepID=UPI00195462A5|nr:CD48 antigen-like [Oreochromis aureus]